MAWGPSWIGAGLLVLLGLAAGCRCAEVVEPAAPPPAAHFAAWDDLVRAAALGEVERARQVGLDLHGGAPAELPEGQDAAAMVAGALGFLRFAEDPQEVIEAVTRAAVACGDCHRVAELPPPARPPFTHPEAGAWATWGLVWSQARTDPPADPEPRLQAAVAAWHEDEGASRVERTEALLGACVACHRGGPGAP